MDSSFEPYHQYAAYSPLPNSSISRLAIPPGNFSTPNIYTTYPQYYVATPPPAQSIATQVPGAVQQGPSITSSPSPTTYVDAMCRQNSGNYPYQMMPTDHNNNNLTQYQQYQATFMHVASASPTQAYFAIAQQQTPVMNTDMSEESIDNCTYHHHSPIQYSPAQPLTPNYRNTGKPRNQNGKRRNYRNNKVKNGYKRDEQPADYPNQYAESPDLYQQQQAAYHKQQADMYNNYYMEQMYYAQQQQQQLLLTPDQSVYGTNENSVDNEFNGTSDYYYNSASNEYYTCADNAHQLDTPNVTSPDDYDYDQGENDAADSSQLACQICRGRRMCFCYFLKVGYYKFPSYVDLVDYHYKKWRTNAAKQKVF